MQQFKLNHLEVDVPRCQIIDNGEIKLVEPRSMDVLAFLAARPRQVISQQTLFDALWPDTVFSPGAIQRCIAQLRKAMADNARQPIYIVTHSKRGYSLDVVPTKHKTSASKKQIKTASWLIICLLVVVWFYVKQQQNQQVGLSGQLTAVTSSSHYDFYPRYSSDAKHLAFIRQQQGQGFIYLKDLQTGSLQQLTENTQNYSSLAWGEDNQSLVFTVNQPNNQWVGEISLEQRQVKSLFSHRGAGDIWRVFPKDYGLYYMLANVPVNKKPVTKMKYFDRQTQTHRDVLTSTDDFTPYRVAMSADQILLAIAGESAQNQVQFRLFDLATNTLTKPFASLPLGFTEINWHPDGKSLVVHYLNELYTLSLDGTFSKLPYNNYQRLFNPVYHPDGKSILVSLSEYDTDLISLDLQTGKMAKLVDSNGEDYLASLSGKGQKMAFVSSRTGSQKLYLRSNQQTTVIFANPHNLPIYRPAVWSNNNNQLAFSFAQYLYLYNLQTQQTSEITMTDSFTAVLGWYSDNKHLLIATKRGNQSYFSKYALGNQSITDLHETGVNYSAKLSQTDDLVFYQAELLYWGERSFELKDLPEISGQVFPVADALIWQSGHQVIRFDGKSHQVLVEQMPEEAMAIADVTTTEQIVFYSQTTQSAKIVQLK